MNNYKYKSNFSSLEKNIKKEIGFQLFCHRHKHKIRVCEVCKALNISPKKLDEIEIGRRKIDFQKIKSLLEFYNLDINVQLMN